MSRRLDSATLLTAYLVLLIGLPSRLVVGQLGGAGSPAVLTGVALLGVWAFTQVQRDQPTGFGAQPVRWGYLLMLGAFLASYVVAMTRAIDPSENNSAQLGLICVLSWGGVVLVANDGIASMARLMTLLRRVVVAGGALATLGILQFFTGQTWVDRISIPGLVASQALGAVSTRSGFNRPPGTALHGIEFGVVITMILPLAFNLALADTGRSLLRRWYPVLAIVMASFISISRSAIVGCVAGLLLVGIGWPRKAKIVTLGLAPVFAVFLFATIPGLIGSLAGLFLGISHDSSADSRTGSYSIAAEFIGRSPLLGRGYATFMPQYRILDNQWLLLLIEVGLVGFVAVMALLIAAVRSAGQVRRRSQDFGIQQVARALGASIVVGAIGLALFDGLSFPMAAGTLFFFVGLAGALRRLADAEPRYGLTARPVPSQMLPDQMLPPPL